jgi:MFS family permease
VLVDTLRDYTAHVKLFSRNARLFLAAATLGGLNGGVAAVLLNLYVLSLGYGEGFVGRLQSFSALAAAGGAVLAGPLADRLGGKRVMLTGTAVAGAGALLLLFVATPVALLAGSMLVTAGSALVYIAAPPFMADQSSDEERPYLFATSAAAYVLSTAAGSAIGGWLVTLFSPAGGTADPQAYRLALFGGALLSGFGIPLLAMIKERRPQGSASVGATAGSGGVLGAAARALLTTIRTVLRPDVVRVFLLLAIADGLIRIGGNLLLPFMDVFFVQHLGVSTAWYGTLKAAERLIVAAATLAVAIPAVRFGPVSTVSVTQLLSIPLLLLVGLSGSAGIASAAFLGRGALMEMTVPVRDNFMMSVVPTDARASVNAAVLLVGYVIAIPSRRLGGSLLEAQQDALVFVLTAGCYALSAVLYWLFFRARPEAAPGRKLDLAALAR